jgi:hypothetical protein
MKSIIEVKQFIIELLKLFPDKKTDLAHIGKAYYYANSFALNNYGTLVSTHYCVKLDFGPGIDDYKEIVDDLIEEGIVCKEEQYFIRLINEKSFIKFPAVILDSINKAYLEVKDKNFNQLKEDTHRLKSYQRAALYNTIDYSDDIFTDGEIERAKLLLKDIPEN